MEAVVAWFNRKSIQLLTMCKPAKYNLKTLVVKKFVITATVAHHNCYAVRAKEQFRYYKVGIYASEARGVKE